MIICHQKSSTAKDQSTLFERIGEASSELKTDIVAGTTAVIKPVADIKKAIKEKFPGRQNLFLEKQQIK